MKITKEYLKKVINEEIQHAMLENNVELDEGFLGRFIAPFVALALSASPGAALAKTSKNSVPKPTATDVQKKVNTDPKVLEQATYILRQTGTIGPDDVVTSLVDISTPNSQGVGYNIKSANGEEYGIAKREPRK